MSFRIEGIGYNKDETVFTGTVKNMIEHKLGIEGRVFTQQELSPILSIMETMGRAKKVGKFGTGFIWEVQLKGSFDLGKAI